MWPGTASCMHAADRSPASPSRCLHAACTSNVNAIKDGPTSNLQPIVRPRHSLALPRWALRLDGRGSLPNGSSPAYSRFLPKENLSKASSICSPHVKVWHQKGHADFRKGICTCPGQDSLCSAGGRAVGTIGRCRLLGLLLNGRLLCHCRRLGAGGGRCAPLEPPRRSLRLLGPGLLEPQVQCRRRPQVQPLNPARLSVSASHGVMTTIDRQRLVRFSTRWTLRGDRISSCRRMGSRVCWT